MIRLAVLYEWRAGTGEGKFPRWRIGEHRTPVFRQLELLDRQAIDAIPDGAYEAADASTTTTCVTNSLGAREGHGRGGCDDDRSRAGSEDTSEIVRGAFAAAFQTLEPGVPCSEVNRTAGLEEEVRDTLETSCTAQETGLGSRCPSLQV